MPRKSAAKSTALDAYFADLPSPARKQLTQMRAVIRAAVPRDATEVISYGMPAFRQKRILVWYGAFADHCSLFPGAAVISRFADDLARFKTSKGTIQFPLDDALPVRLITRIVKARVQEQLPR